MKIKYTLCILALLSLSCSKQIDENDVEASGQGILGQKPLAVGQHKPDLDTTAKPHMTQASGPSSSLLGRIKGPYVMHADGFIEYMFDVDSITASPMGAYDLVASGAAAVDAEDGRHECPLIVTGHATETELTVHFKVTPGCHSALPNVSLRKDQNGWKYIGDVLAGESAHVVRR